MQDIVTGQTDFHCVTSIPSSQIYKDLPCAHTRSNLGQTLAHKQNPINQQPVRRTLDLKVAEEGVRTEQAQDLVKSIVGFGIWVWGLGCSDRGIGRESDSWTTGARAEGKEREVADKERRWLVVEDTIIGLNSMLEFGMEIPLRRSAGK